MRGLANIVLAKEKQATRSGIWRETMNQVKIGTFIADMRKKQGMSQKQLADIVGVTDKSVSKWETGKSLPEISKMESLCEALHININELLSGERLSETVYPQKAEENMMNLIHESEVNAGRANSVGIIVMIVLSLIPIVFSVLYGRESYFNGSVSMLVWIDLPTITAMSAVTALYLIGTKTARTFWWAFVIVSSKQNHDSAQIQASRIAVKMVQCSWLITGTLISILGYAATAFDIAGVHSAQDRYALITLNLALASLGIVYGLIGYLILIPIRTKLAFFTPHTDT